MGELPEVGEWVRLEVDAKQMGLKSGAKIKGFAFTQFGGTVTWDHLGVHSVVDTTKDPTWSWAGLEETKLRQAKQRLPEGLRQLVRGKQADDWSEKEEDAGLRLLVRTLLRRRSARCLAEINAKSDSAQWKKSEIERTCHSPL